jgi:hypothetical protein
MGMGPRRRGEEEADLLKAVVLLKRHGLHATGIVEAYHARRVAPLMVRALPLYQMTPEALLKGTVLSREPLCNSEIEQGIWEVMEVDVVRFEFLILGHLVMHPKPSFVEMVHFFSVSFPG